MSILVVGSMALDDLALPSGSFKNVLGGSATYFSLAAAPLARCRVVAVVGRDFPAATLRRLRAKGIDLSGVEQAAGRTFHWSGRYPRGFCGRETRFTKLGVFAEFSPVIPEAWRDSRTVFLGNIAPELQAKVLDQVRRPRFSAIDTMNFWIEGEREALDSVVRRVDGVFVNDEEVLQWTGASTVFDGIGQLHRKGPWVVVVKRGEFGAYLSCRGALTFVPAVPVRKVIDPTGAGDAFAGGFLSAVDRAPRLDGAALRGALTTASAVASFAVEGVGADALAHLERRGIEQRRRILKKLVETG